MNDKEIKREKVICKNCGAENYDIKGKCSNCGAHLYRFYLEEKRKDFLGNLFKFLIPFLLIIAIASVGIWHYNNTKDPIKNDLEDYLKTLNKTLGHTYETNAYKEYENKVLGTLSSQETKSIWKKYRNLSTIEVYQIIDKRREMKTRQYPIKEKYKSKTDYAEMRFHYLTDKVPATQPVNEAHNHLVNHLDYKKRALFAFYSGMDLGYITNVKENDDGTVGWSFMPDTRKDSDDFTKYSEKAREEKTKFITKLAKLIKKTKSKKAKLNYLIIKWSL